jgi:short-subunit dehydrogenase
MHGSVVAIRGMLEQGSGAVYNMEGLGSNGRKIKGLTLYGTTKYGLAYLTDALAGETKGTPVIVGAIRPGMVLTNLLTKPFDGNPAEWERAKKVFNVLAERVETVTPWIADEVLSNTKSGIRIQWLTPSRLAYCFLRSLFSKRDLFR